MDARLTMGMRAVAVLAAAICAVPAMADHHVTLGEWEMVMDFNGQAVPGTMVISEADDGIAGKWIADGEESELRDLKFEDGTLTFVRTVNYQGSEFDINFSGTIDGDNITGAFSTPAGDLETTGTRGGVESGGKMTGLPGTWTLMVESQLGNNKRTLTVAEDMTAVYGTDEGDFEVENLALDGDAVTFAVTLSMQGQDLPLDFKGKVDGDTLTGEMFMDGSSVATVEGAREGGGGGIAAGEYKLEVDSQIGLFEHKLTVKEDGTMVYESDGQESTPENVSIDGKNVYFTITVHADGASYDLEFEGTFEDGKLAGEYLLDGGSVANVTTIE